MGDELAQYDAWRARIEVAEDILELKAIKGFADGAAEFYEAQGDHINAQRAWEISIRSEWSAGRILLPPSQGGQTPRDRGRKGQPKNVAPLSGDVVPTKYQKKLEDAGIARSTAEGWQALGRIPKDRLEDYFLEHPLEGDKYTVAGVMGLWYQRSDIIEWGTPQWLFDVLDEEFHFALDVCASDENAKCVKYFTIDDKALGQKWSGVCWMNPPYGREIARWMNKAKREAEDGATVVCLVPARPDTEWWWNNCIQHEVRFIKGRLKWPPDDTTAPFPSAVVVMRPETDQRTVWWNVSDRRG